MAEHDQLAPTPRFQRRSETETICMRCYQTIRIQPGDSLEIEEKIHAASCYMPPWDRR